MHRIRFTDTQDGIVGGGLGFGDPWRLVGLEVDVASASTVYQPLFRNSLAGFKIHRMLPGGVGVAVGWDDVVHSKGVDAQSSVYLASSKTLVRSATSNWLSSITASVGVGSGRFQLDTLNPSRSVGLFGSLGLRVAAPVSVIADWNGQDLTLGTSIVPFKSLPFVVTPAVADVTHRVGDGRRFIVSAGIGSNFLR
jgi:hypothetical protein